MTTLPLPDKPVDAPVPPVQPVQPTPPPAPGNTPGQQNVDAEGTDKDPAWLPDRLKRAREAATAELVKQLGVTSADELKALVTEAKRIQEAQMTEAQKATAALEKEQKARAEAEAKVTRLEQARRDDALNVAISSEASAARAEHPQDVIDLIRKGDLSSLLDGQGALKADKVKAAVEQVKKDRPAWFKVGGVGSPSNRNGVPPEVGQAEKAQAQQQLLSNLRKKF